MAKVHLAAFVYPFEDLMMPNHRRATTALPLFLFLALLRPAFVAGSELPDPRRADLEPGKRLEALVERVRHEQVAIETLEAEFTQKKESALLLEPVESKGVFSFSAPDRVRWEYLSPDPISLLIRDDEMTTWFRDIGRAEKMSIEAKSQRILRYLGGGSSMDDLLEYFEVSLAVPEDERMPYRLDLEPRFSRVAKRVSEMSIWVDAERFLPFRLRYVEPDGDATEYLFENIEINAPIPGDRFDLVLPTSVNVRTLELDQRSGLR